MSKNISIVAVNRKTYLLVVIIAAAALVWGLVLALRYYEYMEVTAQPIDLVHLVHLLIIFVLGLTSGMFYAVSRKRMR